MSKMLIISAVFPPEPVVSALLSHDLAEELSTKKDVVVICPTPSRPKGFFFDKIFEPKNYKVIRLKSYSCPSSRIIGRFYESYSFGKSCTKYIRENKHNIKCIYINSWPLLSQYLIVRAAKRYNLPCVLHVQDIYPESLINKIPIGKSIILKILLPIDKYSLKYSKSVIAISENMKQSLSKTREIMLNKIAVVSNWQDEEAFISFNNLKTKNEKDLNSELTFMYLGNNGPLAGVDFLIMSFVKANIKYSKLIIAGSGSRTNACKDLAKSFEKFNIEFIDVPHGMVPVIQDKADIMLLPVKKNGAMSSIPSKLPAYMFSGKPIIGSLDLESDTAKAIKESGCGIVVEPENENELIKAMNATALWTNKDREEKGNLGFEYALTNFSKKENLKKIISVIESVI